MLATRLNSRNRELGPARIRFYGQMGPLGDRQKEALHLGHNLGIRSLCSILPADEEHPDAWHRVVEHQPEGVLYGEAIVLDKEGMGAAFTSRDCPIVVIADLRTGLIGAAHAGRSSLMKIDTECPSCDTGILENLFAAMGNPYGENLLVHVGGGISAKNFPNEPGMIAPFLKKFGPEVVPDPARSTLDLFRVVRKICLARGVKKDNIFSDGLCTYETQWTGSKRAGRDGSNWTYAFKIR